MDYEDLLKALEEGKLNASAFYELANVLAKKGKQEITEEEKKLIDEAEYASKDKFRELQTKWTKIKDDELKSDEKTKREKLVDESRKRSAELKAKWEKQQKLYDSNKELNDEFEKERAFLSVITNYSGERLYDDDWLDKVGPLKWRDLVVMEVHNMSPRQVSYYENKAGVEINRKMLSELAIYDKEAEEWIQNKISEKTDEPVIENTVVEEKTADEDINEVENDEIVEKNNTSENNNDVKFEQNEETKEQVIEKAAASVDLISEEDKELEEAVDDAIIEIGESDKTEDEESIVESNDVNEVDPSEFADIAPSEEEVANPSQNNVNTNENAVSNADENAVSNAADKIKQPFKKRVESISKAKSALSEKLRNSSKGLKTAAALAAIAAAVALILTAPELVGTVALVGLGAKTYSDFNKGRK